MSVLVGLATFLVMPASIAETHKIFRGRAAWLHSKTGWFTEREEKIGVNRILRDDPSKGDMNNRQHVDLKGIWHAVRDYDLWPTYIVSSVTACHDKADDVQAWNHGIHPVPTCYQLSLSDAPKSRVHCLRSKHASNSRLLSIFRKCEYDTMLTIYN